GADVAPGDRHERHLGRAAPDAPRGRGTKREGDERGADPDPVPTPATLAALRTRSARLATQHREVARERALERPRRLFRILVGSSLAHGPCGGRTGEPSESSRG